MKYTLLDLTQLILSSMDSDEIDSISDSPEALQVVSVIKTTYFDIINRAEFPTQFDLCKLDASGDASLPFVMYIPDDIEEILWVKYDNQTIDTPIVSYQPVYPLTIPEFIQHQLNQTGDDTTTQYTLTINSDPYYFFIRTDQSPKFYCVTADRRLIFDAFDSSVDTTLQRSKTLCYGQKKISWTESDTFIPDLDDKEFSILLNEAKALAFNELKQTTHVTAERNAHRGWVDYSRRRKKLQDQTDFDRTPKYGRR